MEKQESSKTVLIVENDQDVRDTLRGFIEQMGHRALWADRASRALQVIEGQGMEGTPVDLLLLDIHMPGPHGHHLLTYLKNKNRRVPPTIVVSGFLDKDLISELIRLGVNGIVAKPFNFQRLREEIDRVLVGVPKGTLLCSQCGRSLRSGDRFCRSCGKVVVVGQKCPGCGGNLEPGDRYCGTCGLGLNEKNS